MKKMTPNLAALMIGSSLACAAPALAADDVVIVYDASGSMWGQIDGISKIEIARDVMADLVAGWDTGTNLGLVAYGHRNQGDCTDIETLITPGPMQKNEFLAAINAIKPLGKTPISASVQHAADLLSYRDNPATVVLISDGVETCNADPCALSAQLAKQGVKFTAHVVGFDLKDDENASLSCIAENTGGMFVPARNAAELNDALAQVQSAITLQPTAPAPEPEPEPVLPEVILTGPQTVTTGAMFDFTWSGGIHPRDFITIVPMGAKDGESGDYIRVNDNTEGSLTAPAEVGLYELRYVLNEGRRTLATAQIEVVEGEVGLAGPQTVTTGAMFDFTWSGNIHPRDFITIVPMGAKDGESGDYIRVNDNTEGSLTAPAEVGLYELRYVLNEGRRTLATAQIEVVEGEVGLAGPQTVTTGAMFDFTWSGGIHPRDFITIVPMGAKDGESGDYIRVNDNTEGSLTAPAEVGLYELRYVLNEGKRTLATAPIEVVEGEVGLAGPETVTTGAMFDFTWSGGIHPRDFITIVPMGAKDGESGDYIRVNDNTEGSLTAPAEVGLYELRYVLNQGKRTLATAPIEVVTAEVTLTGPSVVRAGETVNIGWSQTINPNDFITIVPAGAAEGRYDDYFRARSDTQNTLNAPKEPGIYEIRYILNKGHMTLATALLEVVGKDAPLDDGAGLSVPETAAPGSTITVTWTGENDSSDQRIALARKDQPDFSWISVQKIAAEKTMDLTMPDEPGLYEVRFLDVAGRALLGRAVIEVK
ncbi:vWA domain-containing protein [Oceaniglobus ichthyenteri]|uniref:vWA domain-containing protein n=1 Tax=Oceaniglobus ichthyenteri TaxID=2136177 RepID=UPI0013DE0AF5|nr:VWA domain-containing protein [Oceaniglobus ichthyenteri]